MLSMCWLCILQHSAGRLQVSCCTTGLPFDQSSRLARLDVTHLQFPKGKVEDLSALSP